MKKGVFTVERTRLLSGGVWEMVLFGDTSALTAPGQFVNIALPGKFLRRPISVCDWRQGRLVLLVKAVGGGTQTLVALPAGTELDVLTGLGNGFDMSLGGTSPILAGGGIGIAPLYGLARRLIEAGTVPQVALGFRTKEESYYGEEFAALGCGVQIATEDGSLGEKGFVTSLIENRPGYLFACGPLPMLKAVHALSRREGGQYSFEARMACGFGACMGCTVPVKGGYKRVCKDGPILYQEEIIW